MTTLRPDELAQPVPERIESTLRHDPYINVPFIEMFDHPDNADIKRAIEVGLAINDPEPVDEDAEPELPRLFRPKDDDGLVGA